MKVEKNVNGDITRLTIIGRVDSITASELEKAINDSITNTRELILDCSKLDYVSSACLRVLLKAQKKLGKETSMRLVEVSEDIMEVFKLTGFNSIINIKERK